jgi:hypothetical protein
VVLGQVVGVEAGLVIGLYQLQTLPVLHGNGVLAAIHVIENTEFHVPNPERALETAL